MILDTVPDAEVTWNSEKRHVRGYLCMEKVSWSVMY